MGGLVLDRAVVADLADDRIEEDDRPHRPGSNGRVCHSRTSSITASVILEIRSGGDLNVVDVGQVGPDVTDRHPVDVEADHDLVDAVNPPLPFADDLRLVGAVAVPRHLQVDVAGLGQQRLDE
jgi:hypothetical protein